MTKYILGGGGTRQHPEQTKQFFAEMTRGLPSPITVLCVYFAREQSFWSEVFADDQNNFRLSTPEAEFDFVLADSAPKILEDQIRRADIIYMRGGKTRMLIEIMQKIVHLSELWKDKVVAGSSAGAYLLTSYYYGNDSKRLWSGLGILPIKAFCHYTDANKKELDALEAYGEPLPLYRIPEGEYIVLTK